MPMADPNAGATMLIANIGIKLTVDGGRWYVTPGSASIDIKNVYAIPPGEFFPSKDVAITESVAVKCRAPYPPDC